MKMKMKMKTTEVGNISLGKVIAAFLSKKFIVSLPLGDGYPYDLLVDDRTKILRIQVKTGRLLDGALCVHLRSNNGMWTKRKKNVRSYKGKIDAFASYCRETNECFLIPINKTGRNEILLRMDKPKNNQIKKIRWAKDYLI
jgi:hypothetical protein